MILVAGNSVYASDVRAAFARNALRSIFITSLPPARNQPRAEIPKPATDVDAFLTANATDKTLLFRLQKGFQKKKSHYSLCVFLVPHKELSLRCLETLQLSAHLFAISPHMDPQ